MGASEWAFALGGAFLAVGLACALGRRLAVRRWGRCANRARLDSRTALVTGASGGIGRETAAELARRGARVVLACRSLAAASRIVAELELKFPQARVTAMELDLASFESIVKFVKRVVEERLMIDILVNNAGVAVPLADDARTEDGYEMNFGVNHLGHFLLTNLLLGHTRIAVKGRIIIVSSMLMKQGKIDFDDMNSFKVAEAIRNGSLSSWKDPGYANSKLMNAYHGKALAEKVKDFGIDVFILCPGFTYSNLFRHTFRWYFVFFIPLFFFVMRSTKQGAQTSIYCATEPSIEGKSGSFFSNCKEADLPVEYDKQIADRLWLISEELTKTSNRVSAEHV